MNKNNPQTKNEGGAGKVMAGVGMVALAAAAAGAIFFYGTDAGKKKRKEIRSWTLRMQADVIDKMEKMKDWSEMSYQGVVDAVVEKYKNIKNIDPAELATIAEDLKKHWRNIKRHIEGLEKKVPAKRKAPAKKKADSESTTSTS